MQNQWSQPIRIRLARATFPPCLQSCFFRDFLSFFKAFNLPIGVTGVTPDPEYHQIKKIGPGFLKVERILGGHVFFRQFFLNFEPNRHSASPSPP